MSADKMSKVTFTPIPKANKRVMKDLDELSTEEELQKRLLMFQERHKMLMETDERYAATFNSLPEQRVESNIPLNERVVVPAVQMLVHMDKYTRWRKRWSEEWKKYPLKCPERSAAIKAGIAHAKAAKGK